MEEQFKKLRETGKNTVEGLLQWLQESKIIENTKEATDKARKLFDEVINKQDVEVENFKKVVTKLAEEQKKNVDDFVKNLDETVPKFQEAVGNAAKAFQETMNKK